MLRISILTTVLGFVSIVASIGSTSGAALSLTAATAVASLGTTDGGPVSIGEGATGLEARVATLAGAASGSDRGRIPRNARSASTVAARSNQPSLVFRGGGASSTVGPTEPVPTKPTTSPVVKTL